MKIDLKELQLKIDSIDKTINEYESNILNLYNQLLSTSIYWKDKRSLKFNEKVTLDKKQANIKLLELKSTEEILKYIISKYENIGQKIKFDLKGKEKINKLLDDYILQLEKILDQYEQIDLSHFNELRVKLTKQELVLKELKNNMKTIKDNINEKFNKLEEIELQIAQRLNKIKIEYIKEATTI